MNTLVFQNMNKIFYLAVLLMMAVLHCEARNEGCRRRGRFMAASSLRVES